MHFVVPAFVCPLSLSNAKKILVRIFKVALAKIARGYRRPRDQRRALSSNFVPSKFVLRRDDGLTTARRGAATPVARPFSRQSYEYKEKFPARRPGRGSFGELGDPMREARHFAAGIVLMDDAALRGTHDGWLRVLKRRQGRVAVAAGDRFLDLADRTAQQRAARFVDDRPARDLARGFAGGLGIGHEPLVHNWRFAAERPPKRLIFARKRGGKTPRRHGRGL